MRSRFLPVFAGALALLLLAACSASPGGGRPDRSGPVPPATASAGTRAASPHPYVGMWVTADGHIRQQLLPAGRYDEARGDRESAYTGSYRVSGTRIDYVDDTGFTADGDFVEPDVLHHGGYVFYREGSDAHRRAAQNR